MASLVQRPDGRLEIRETVSTPRGPRSRTLASFRGQLTPEVVERAVARATRPISVADLVARADALGVPVTRRREDRAARALLARLRQGASLAPALRVALRDALDATAEVEAGAGVPDVLSEVIDWVGASLEQRGAALRGLLRVSDRIVRARDHVRERRRRTFPRFSSEKRAA